MFTILVTEPLAERGISGWWQRLHPPRPRLEECRTMDIPWRLIRAASGKNGPDWKKIGLLAGSHRAKLVTAGQERPPQNSGIRVFEPMAMARVMAARGICAALSGHSGPVTVGVLDPEARCLTAVEILMETAHCVKVYTCRPDRYEWFARYMLEQKGAPVVLCHSAAAMEGCTGALLGVPFPEWRQWIPQGCFAAAAFCPGSADQEELLWGFEARLPPELAAQIPAATPPQTVLAALYELAGRRELAGLAPQSCMAKGRRTSMEELRTALVRSG